MKCATCYFRLYFGERSSLGVVGVEKLVSQVRVRLAQELIVERLDLGVVVRLAKNLSFILRVEGLCSLFLVGIYNVKILVGQEALTNVGLTATVDTTTGATHDLDKVILALACADLVKQNSCILHTVSHCDVDGLTCQLKACFLDAFKAAGSFKLHAFDLLAGEYEVSRTNGCFHNAAGNTEDHACAGVLANDVVVKLFIGKLGKVNTASLNESAKLSGGDNGVNVCHAYL